MKPTAPRVFAVLLIGVLLFSWALIWAAAYWGDTKEVLLHDGKAYYAWLRSLALDRDIDFHNDYRLLFPEMAAAGVLPLGLEGVTPRGLPTNKYPIGMAIIETPGFAIGHLVAKALPGFAEDGVSLPYQLGVTWWLIAAYLGSFVLLYRGMRRLGTSPNWAAVLCSAMLVCTNLLHYVAREAFMAHGAGVAVLNLLVFLVSRWPEDWRRVCPVERMLAGALAGLLFLIRNSNVVLYPFVLALCVRRRGLSVRSMWPMACAALCIAAVQPFSLYFLWGEFRLVGYWNESFTGGLAGIAGSLFSSRHGLFFYHPWYAGLLLLCAFALCRMPDLRGLALGTLVGFFGLVLFNGLWWCWWYALSFGNRGYIETLVPLTVVAGLFLSHLPLKTSVLRTAVSAGLVLCVVNLYLWAGYLLARYPQDGRHSIFAAYGWAASSKKKSALEAPRSQHRTEKNMIHGRQIKWKAEP